MYDNEDRRALARSVAYHAIPVSIGTSHYRETIARVAVDIVLEFVGNENKTVKNHADDAVRHYREAAEAANEAAEAIAKLKRALSSETPQ